MLKYLRMGNKRQKLMWWALIVVTVVTFLGGFVFILGSGLDTSTRARTHGDLGTVNGNPVTRVEYDNALYDQRANFQKQSGSDPSPEEARDIATQAWRMVVTQKMLSARARSLGLGATDREVVLALQTSPPSALADAPVFKTNGKFDPQKYMAAIRDPNNNWAPFEDMVRDQLPLRKLQDRMVASLKPSQPELVQAFHDRFDHVSATVLQIPPSQQGNVPPPSEADIDRIYQQFRSRFASGPRTQLEVLQIPMRFAEEDVRSAKEQIQSIADRARRGEDFATLAKDNSEGPNASKGGELNRVFQPHEFGQALEAKMAALQKGDISEPFQDGPYWVVLKVLDRISDPMSPIPNLRVAQIAIRIRLNEATMQEQEVAARKIRERATKVGLGKAAAENGLATTKTGFYDYDTPPPQLAAAARAADWGLSAKVGAVSDVVEGLADFTIVQVAAQRPAGAPGKEEVIEDVRRIAEVDARVSLAKSTADQVSAALAQGKRLEDIAKPLGLMPMVVASMSRAQPDPRLAPVPEVVGVAFGTPVGGTAGPVRTLAGWYFVRVDHMAPADSASFDQLKAQITQDIMTKRQTSFFSALVADLRSRATVKDFRGDLGE
jgi:parvulin-like peptidyl-prolyl isomerase